MFLLLGIVFYIASIIAGVALANYFLYKLTDEILVRYAFSFPIGFVVASYLVFAMEAMTGAFSSYLMVVASVLLIAMSYFLYQKSRNKEMFDVKLLSRQYRANRRYYILVFAIIFLLLVLQFRGISQNRSGIVEGGNYGYDFLFHLSVGNSVVYTTFPPKLLYISNTRNVFPFITDFFTAMLMYTGMNPVYSLYLTNIPLYFSLVMLSVYLIYVVTKRRYAAVVGFVLFLLCSLWLNAVVLYLTGISLPFAPNSMVHQYAQGGWSSLFELPIYNFSDPLINNFASQHDYVLGFPYTLTILLFLYFAFFKKGGGEGRKRVSEGLRVGEFAFVGLLVGLMPLVHPFSMIFVFMFALVGFFYSAYSNRSRFKGVFLKRWLPLSIGAVVVALPMILYMHSGNLSSDFFMSELSDSIWYTSGASIPELIFMHVEFWLVTIGALLVLGLIGLYLFRKDLILFVPAFLALLMVNIIRVQPSFGDSNKITLYFLFFMGLSASELLARMAKMNVGFKALTVVLFVLVTLGGFLPEYSLLTSGPNITVAPSIEVNASAWIAANTPGDAVFVNNCYNNVFGIVSSLADRQVILEDRDYVYLDGLYSQNPYELGSEEAHFLNNPTCSFINKYNASYVLLINSALLSPDWCKRPNYAVFLNSSNFTEFKSFAEPNSNITIFKSECN